MGKRFAHALGSHSFKQLAGIIGVASALGCGGGGDGSGGSGSGGDGGGAGFGGSGYGGSGYGGSGHGGSGGDGGSAGYGGSGSDGGAAGSGGSASNSTSSNSGGTGSGGDGGTGSMPGLAYPLWLTPLGNPSTETAHVGLYFTVTDALQQPVPGLMTDDFIARENDQSVDPFESAFRVDHPTGQLVIPTVLVLDLSRSVVEAGALDEVKGAAKAIIDSLAPAQELAILTFAGDVTQRSSFTRDTYALHEAIDAIEDADGISTNLYGALTQGYGLWYDGFYDYNDNSGAPQLVAGLLIAVSDGNDTSAVSTLQQVLDARGTKRTIFIRVGDDLDRSVASQIANAGVIDAEGGFDGLDGAVVEVTQRVASLNDAIYVAEYCSPKRANTHDLFFTVAGNEEYVSDPVEALCNPSGAGPSCDGSDYYCGPDYSGEWDYLCCDPEYPFMCSTGCYRTQEDAYANCGSSCIECGASSDHEDNLGDPATSIEIQFNATGFSDEQCAGLFDEGTGGTGGTGGTSSGGSGGGPGASAACTQLIAAARDFCGAPAMLPGFALECAGNSVEMSGDCGAVQFADCESDYDAYLICLTESIVYDGAWQCSAPAATCTYSLCPYEFIELGACIEAP